MKTQVKNDKTIKQRRHLAPPPKLRNDGNEEAGITSRIYVISGRRWQ